MLRRLVMELQSDVSCVTHRPIGISSGRLRPCKQLGARVPTCRAHESSLGSPLAWAAALGHPPSRRFPRCAAITRIGKDPFASLSNPSGC